MLYSPTADGPSYTETLGDYTFRQSGQILPWTITKTPFGNGEFKGEEFYEPITENYEIFFHPDLDSVASVFDNEFVILSLDTTLINTSTNQTDLLQIIQAQELSRQILAGTLIKKGVSALPGITYPVENYDSPVVTCANASAIQPVVVFTTPDAVLEPIVDGVHVDENPYCVRVVASFDIHAITMVDRLRFGLIANE